MPGLTAIWQPWGKQKGGAPQDISLLFIIYIEVFYMKMDGTPVSR